MRASIAYDRMAYVQLVAYREQLFHQLDLVLGTPQVGREIQQIWERYFLCLQELKLRGVQTELDV